MFSTTHTSIVKRNGQTVSFDPNKIYWAVQKAYLATLGKANDELIQVIVKAVLNDLDTKFAGRTPGVEDIQNHVERQLMAQNLFDVAKHYIIYRYEHTKEREVKREEILKKVDAAELMVTKRDGSQEPFDLEKIVKFVQALVAGHDAEHRNAVDPAAVARQCRLEVYEGISTADIERAVIQVLRSYIEIDPAYSYIAAKALFLRAYKDVIGETKLQFGELTKHLREQFPKSISTAVSIGKLNPRMLTFDLPRLANELKPERDHLFNFLGAQTLLDRYFITDPVAKQLLELPQIFWMRVAMGLSLNETEKNEKAIEFYHLLSTLMFTASTPTLFHSGTNHPQLSSCYLTTIEDSLDHIFKCIGDNGQLSKWSGGIGNDWTNLRGTGALIRGTGVDSQGIIPFLKIANDTTVAINRSGKRRGATCAYLETWHYDIEDFLELRKNTGDERRRTHDMNTANWVPDLFMQRVRQDGMWTLFSPEETPDLHHIYGRAFKKRYEHYEAMAEAGKIRLFKRLPARDLWRKMLTMLFETGHPWITFKDACNVRSPQDHVGVVHSSNLCTEITLNTSADETAVCNLGSVNLGRHIVNGKLDLDLLRRTVRVAMRMLDNVVDLNFYPTVEAEKSNLRHRPVGLGIMGFHDALYQLGMVFDSEAAVQFASSSMEAVSYYAILASTELAAERGPYSTFRGSKWDRGLLPQDTVALLSYERGEDIPAEGQSVLDWAPVRAAIAEHGMRNSNCLAIAPTATISNIANSIPSIEPIYKNLYVKSNQSGEFVEVNEYLVAALKERNLWNPQMLQLLKYHDGNLSAIAELPQDLKDKFKEVFQIDAKWLIRAAAARGQWIDQSQSLNIFYGGKSGKDIANIYQYAWERGIKTTYYLRTMAATQVEKSTVSAAEFGNTHIRDAVSADPVVQEEVVVVTVDPPQDPLPIPDQPSLTEIKLCKIEDPTCEACQ